MVALWQGCTEEIQRGAVVFCPVSTFFLQYSTVPCYDLPATIAYRSARGLQAAAAERPPPPQNDMSIAHEGDSSIRCHSMSETSDHDFDHLR